jgi:tRNA U55 pseudouridine synthase TruB
LHALRRLRSEPFDLSRATSVRELYELPADAVWERAAVPIGRALDVLPAVILQADQAAAVGHGRAVAIDVADVTPAAIGGGPRSVVLRDMAGRPLALGDVHRNGALEARPHVVFPWALPAATEL